MRDRRVAKAVLVLALAPLAAAHEDDPKILDRVGPYVGPGYRRGAPAGGDGSPLAVAGFPSQGVTLLAWLPLGELDGAQSANDIWGYVSPSGREYALVGTWNGLVVVEVSDPVDPQVIGIVPGPLSLWRDVKTYQGHAYVVSEGGDGIQIVDLSAVDAGTVTLLGEAGFGPTHNVALDETSGFLYRCGGGAFNGLTVYDLSDPAEPVQVATWFDRYVHDAQVVTYEEGPYAGRQIAFLCGGLNGGSGATRLEVLDVTNKASLERLSFAAYPDRAYAHQGWLSPGRRWFYLGDELDEDGSLKTTTHVIDVSDVTNARWVTSFTNGNNAIGHNLFTRQNLILEANYTSGLRVFDATDPFAPVEIGWFDTWPTSDADSFNGLWGLYTMLPSGIVIGSDMERGLFVWWVDAPELQVHLPADPPPTLHPDGTSFLVDVVEEAPGALEPGSARLVWDAGSGFVETPLVPLGRTLFRAEVPRLECGTAVNWFLSVESTTGIPWTNPPDAPIAMHRSIVGVHETIGLAFDMEADEGWSRAQGDTAQAGRWVRVDPVGSAAQPADDRSPEGTAGSACWVTGQGSPGGDPDADDVDAGTTTLLGPRMDLSGATDPYLAYWRWFSNDVGGAPGEDVLAIDLSNDGGATWHPVERVGPGGPHASGGWFQHAFRVADVAAPTAAVRLRIVASDLGRDSTVEAAIDGVQAFELVCRDCNGNRLDDTEDVAMGRSLDTNFDGVPDECQCPTEVYCVRSPNSWYESGGASIGSSGVTNISSGEFTLRVTSAVGNAPGVFFYGPARIQAPFGDGFRCVGAGGVGIFRLLPPVFSDPLGVVSRRLDFGSAPADAGPGHIEAMSTWNFQLWFRDPAGPGGSGFNLSDALSVTFCP